jgi:BT1 family
MTTSKSFVKIVCVFLSYAAVCSSFLNHHRQITTKETCRRNLLVFNQRQSLHTNHGLKIQPSILRAMSEDIDDFTTTDSKDIKKPFLLSGIELSPELIAILTVYFVQGALGLSRLAVSFFMKDELHLSPTDMAAIGGITSLPWLIKPLYGFLSDGIPIFGYKRRSYLIIAGILGCLSWLALGTIVTDTSSAVAAITLGSASVAVSDVVADSIVVEKSRKLTQGAKAEESISPLPTAIFDDTGAQSIEYLGVSDENKSGAGLESEVNVAAGDLQSLCWSAAAIGGILSAYFSGSLLQTVSPRFVFTLTALFPLLISAVSFLIDEKAEVFRPSLKEFSSTVGSQFTTLKETLINPKIYLPVLFIFAWQATPTPDSAMFFFTTGELGFEPEFLGRVRLAASLAALAGVTIYRTFLKDISIKQVILWTSLLSVPLSLTQLMLVTHYNRVLGIPDQVFALTDTVVLTVLGQIAFMPTLVLASTLCPPGIEGTLFASLMSIYNAAGTLASELGAGLTSLLGVTEKNYDNLPTLVLVCSLASLLPLPFINILDKALDTQPVIQEEEGANVVLNEILD